MKSQSRSKRRLLIGATVGGILFLVTSTIAAGVAIAGDQNSKSPIAAPVDTDKGGQLLTSVDDPEQVAKQEKLDFHVDKLHESGLLDSAVNFGGDAVDYDANAYDLWWRGDPPSDVQSALKGFDDIAVRLHDAKYTAHELAAAGNRVAQHSSDQFDIGLVSIESLKRPTPVYGIEVEVTKKGDLSGTAIAAELTETAGLPVAVDESLKSLPASRANDSAPYWAGGVLDAPEYCTTGFAVKKDDGGKLLSAEHCSGVTNTLYDGGGTIIANPPPNHLARVGLDSLLIDPDGSSAARTYTGPSSGSVNSRVVRSIGVNGLGKTSCQSGSNSGERCGLELTQALIGPCGDASVCRYWLATDGAGVNLAQGDSGGPVYVVRSDGAVAARGIVSRGSTTVTCDSGVRFPSPNLCFRNVIFVEITDILDTWNATLLTQ